MLENSTKRNAPVDTNFVSLSARSYRKRQGLYQRVDSEARRARHDSYTVVDNVPSGRKWH